MVDCCDGSDEYASGVQCENTCGKLMQSYQKEKGAEIEIIQAGILAREEIVKNSSQLFRQDQHKLEQLKEQLEKQKEIVLQSTITKEKEELQEKNEQLHMSKSTRLEIAQSLGLDQLNFEQLSLIIVDLSTQVFQKDDVLKAIRVQLDASNLGSSPIEKEELVKNEPDADKWIRRYTGAQEFINGYSRYCLWLVNIQPQELKKSKEIYRRVEEVRKVRSESNRKTTQELSKFPTLFGENRQPDTNYLLIPGVSSENRKYIPTGFLSPDIITSNSCLIIPYATLYHFGILTSEMHMAWVKYVCGRLKSDYRYSNTIVYNNFPFPENITDKQKQTVETCAQAVLDTRAKYPDSSLADLYDPLTMPPDLLKAHQKLDKAVDLCYRPQPFTSELNRIEYLFELYEKLTAPLLPTSKQKPRKRKNSQ